MYLAFLLFVHHNKVSWEFWNLVPPKLGTALGLIGFVVSVSHLNREGNKMIDENITANKFDLTRLLGRNNVGESLLMLDNLDMGIIITKEYDKDMNAYIGFSTIKMSQDNKS